MTNRSRRRAGGFTLIELLVVIIIIIIVASVSVALMNVFFRGQGVRQGATLVTSAFAKAKQLAADQRVVHFIYFYNAADGGKMVIYKDADGDKVLNTAADIEVPGKHIELPKYVNFMPTAAGTLQWAGVEPSGYTHFNPGFNEIQAGTFEGNFAGSNPNAATCDILLQVQGKPFKMCIDVDKPAGKVRKSHFLNN